MAPECAVPMQDLALRIHRRADHFGLAVTLEQVNQLAAYFGLLAKWNSRINLTSLDVSEAADSAVDRLLMEPIAAAAVVSPSDRLLIDLGSGGGSPGLPLKVMAGNALTLILVEAKERKCAFLRDAVRELDLGSVEVLNLRFEQLATRIEQCGAADLVSVRAVRADEVLSGTIEVLLRPGGRLLWFGSTSEAQAFETSSLRRSSVRGLPSGRQLEIFEKGATHS